MDNLLQLINQNNIQCVILPYHLAHLADQYDCPVFIRKPTQLQPQTQPINEPTLVEQPVQAVHQPDHLYTIQQLKTLMEQTKTIKGNDYAQSSINTYLNHFKTIMDKYFHLQEPYNFTHIETNMVEHISDIINDDQHNDKARTITIFKTIYELSNNTNPKLTKFLTQMINKILKDTAENKSFQPPNPKQQTNRIYRNQLKTIRDELFKKVAIDKSHNKDSIAFILSSIYYHLPPLRPTEISNTVFTENIDNTNYIDFTNLKWYINEHKSKTSIENRTIDIPQELANDIQLFISLFKEKSNLLIPQFSDYLFPMSCTYLAKIYKPYFQEYFKLPNVNFQIIRTSIISEIVPTLNIQQQKDFAKQCGHMWQTQQTKYLTYNQQ
jgi:hypothetical protein